MTHQPCEHPNCSTHAVALDPDSGLFVCEKHAPADVAVTR